MIKLIVFDFDGTLADSKKTLLSIVSRNLKTKKYKINKEYERKFGDKPLKKGFEDIGISKEEISSMVKKIQEDFIKESRRIRIVNNIEKLREIKIDKIIISNNIKDYIKGALKNKARIFNEIHGWPEFKSRKDEEFRKILKKRDISPKDVLYVGDRAIDAIVARKAGCYSVVISNKISWSSKKDILNVKPDFVISDLKELRDVVDKLNFK